MKPFPYLSRALFASLTMLALALLLPSRLHAQTPPHLDARWLLFVSQDESSTEKRIAKYIEKVHKIVPKYKFTGKNDNDAILIYTLKSSSAPKLRVFIDTIPSSHDRKTKKVLERTIMIKTYFKLPPSAKTRKKRARIHALNDVWMQRHTFPHKVYLDKDGDIAMGCIINIPSSNIPIHAEMVYDTLTRILTAWIDYHKILSRIL